MTKFIVKCRVCGTEVNQEYNMRTCENYLYCEICKVHETIYWHDDYQQFYKVEIE